ncbi:MAG: oxidoreductase, partial [Desulfobulbus sp.]
MTDITTKTCDVAVIGGGPSGLSAAITLKQAGVKSV